jgi:hypothetical protein
MTISEAAMNKMQNNQQRRSTTKIYDIDDSKHQELEEEEDMLSLNEKLSHQRSNFILYPDS